MPELDAPRPFSGGLALRPYKAPSTSRPVERVAVPARLVIAMSQHAGPPARPVVRPGQRVACGERIGAAEAPGSVAVHASAAGTVESLESRVVPSGARLVESVCAIIATDGGHEDPVRASWPATATARLAAIRDAGIVGLGGAAFPTSVKLGTRRPCHTLILDGAECEPFISCDDMLMRAHADGVLAGASIMLELLGADRCLVAIERDKTAALAAVAAALERLGDGRFTLAAVPTVYPAGGERQLVESLLGEEVPSGGYPIDIGVVCQNVATAHALAELAARGRPLLSRIVTVTGHGVREPRNVEARIGTPIEHLIGHCGGLRGDAVQLILGGNMMGYALPSDGLPVTKSTNCVIAMSASEAWMGGQERPCIRCGECASACPARLLPQELFRAVRASRYGALDELGLADCIECGCCDVVCPSHIPLTSILRAGKPSLDRLLDRRRRAAAAEERHARRAARDTRAATEAREAQERLKEPIAGDAAARRAAIAAAVERARRHRGGAGRDADDGGNET